MKFKKFKQTKSKIWYRMYNNLSLSNKILLKIHIKSILD